MRTAFPSLVVVSVLWVMSGCGGLTAVDDAGEGGEGGAVPPAVRAAFAGACATPGCHDAGARAGGLSLAGDDIAATIGAPSSGSPLPMVTIGDVGRSYLAIKMLPDDVLQANGLTRTGARMPITGNFTHPDNAVILAWVAGAEFPAEGGTTTGAGTTSDGSTSDSSTSDGSTTDPSGGEAGFAADIWPLLMAKCSCHSNGGEPSDALNGGLVFTMADAYDALVGAPAVDVPAMSQVEPGEPSQSYLWHKIAGTQASVGGAGLQMPPGPPLSASERALVEGWILAGAPP